VIRDRKALDPLGERRGPLIVAGYEKQLAASFLGCCLA